MVRGKMLSADEVDRFRIFEVNTVKFDSLEYDSVRKFFEKYFKDFTLLDSETGNIIKVVQDPTRRIFRYRIRVIFHSTEFLFDKVFIDKDKLVFMNSINNSIRRVNPSRIVDIELIESERIIFNEKTNF